MKSFRERLDEIYPSPFFGFGIVTIIAIAGIVFIGVQGEGVILTTWSFVIVFVWLYALYSTLRDHLIRKRIFDLTYVSKKELVIYLEKRMKSEKLRFNVFRDNKKRVELIREFKLDIEKDKFKG